LEQQEQILLVRSQASSYTRAVRRYAIPGIFVLSGAAGLIFEVVWSRQLVLVFGNTTQAISAILTGFFGGMAIGSAAGGQVADRVRRPLRLYAILELALALIVILTPVTFHLIHEVYRSAFASLEQSPALLSLLRFGLALIALAPATMLMGATLPSLTRYLARDASALGGAFTRLYTANTIGAVFGAAAAGFVLIELLGLSGALIVGAICSTTAGAVAFVLDAVWRGSAHVSSGGAFAPARQNALALSFAFVSGFTCLSYQTLWTRLIASGTGSSTYVFSTILTVFLIGLALGSVEYKRVRARIRDVPRALALSQLFTAIFAVAGMFAMNALDARPLAFVWKALAVVLPTTFVMGFGFPAASALVGGGSERVGASSGALLSSNTLGAIVGTFCVPFFFIPLFGSAGVLAITACVNLIAAFAIAVRAESLSLRSRLLIAGSGTIFVLVLIGARVTNQLVDPNVARMKRNHASLYRAAEDEIAAVQAGEARGRQHLWVTGFSMTSLTVDAKLMSILPLMLRPASTSVLTIAFGMGSSYRSAIIAGMQTDAVELVPSVPKMFELFYRDAQRYSSSSKGRILIGDGRSHVELTNRTYDLIVVDPPPPLQSSGVSIISSREFYIASRHRLNAGGVMMQWLPWGQTMDDFKTHVRTFSSVFTYVIVATGTGGNGFYMLGSLSPIAFDSLNIRGVLIRPGVLSDISSAFDSPARDLDAWQKLIPQLVRLKSSEVGAFAGDGELITDDKPLPEYFLIRRMRGSGEAWLNPDEVRAKGDVE
jgi:spermidine synthase